MTTARSSPAYSRNLRSLGHFAADIKIAHSIFAMPFAAAAFILGALPWPSIRQVLLLIACMVTARSFAMGMNRYLDRKIDALNPRTSSRRIPRGDLSPGQGLAWSLGAGGLFIAAAVALSPAAGYCAAPLLVILGLYSVMKHVSWLTHWYLGLCLGLAPVGVMVAITGTVSWAVLLVGLGVCLWTAGFDILYALQDLSFDREHALHSVPRHFGPARSLWLSRASFVLMLAALAGAGWLAHRGPIYAAGLAAMACLLTYEHLLVRDARDTGVSQHLNLAFFNMNAYVSVLYLVFTTVDAWLS